MELVFEIGCEDLPARFVEPTMRQLRDHFVEQCVACRLDVQDARVVGTPRRIALLCTGLPERARDLAEERTGPPAAVAFRDGAPTKAAEGFARGQGVSVDDLYTITTDKGEYVAAKVFEAGGATRDLLGEILTAVIASLHFPKSMTWGDYRVPFGRPVRSLVAVLDGEVLPVSFANIAAGDQTLGHRFAPAPGHDNAPSVLTVTGVDNYLAAMRDSGILVDLDERRARVAELVATTAAQVGGTAVDDPALIDEVTNLVESPHAVLVRYDEAYLDLPDEVLVTSMATHQRYFAVQGADGKLTNACVVIYNTPVRDPAVVAAGNLRVLKARLDDARFFWEQDQRQPLADYLPKLDTVLWLKQLGSMRAKSDRIASAAAQIARAAGFRRRTVDAAYRAGELCKADLVTSMVYEFTDLQGVIGREYALRSGEPEAVAQAIGEQYLPKGSSDELPQSDVGACVALAEKLDSLVGCFLIDLVPTSTADPYALRRAALGVIRILQDRGWTLAVDALIDEAAAVFIGSGMDVDWTSARRTALLDFIAGRLEHQLTAEYPTDIVRAVLAVGLEDVTSVTDRVAALTELRNTPEYEPLTAGFKRVVNILRKQAAEFADEELTIDPTLFEHPEEKRLTDATQATYLMLVHNIERRNWPSAIRILASIHKPVDRFFDNVMVMAEDPAVKRNRLAILFQVEALFKRVADLSVVS